jgi:metal-responsive CopG/Arc/MetJ family transcriptional regulator
MPNTSVHLSEELAERFEEATEETNKSKSAFIREAIREKLDRPDTSLKEVEERVTAIEDALIQTAFRDQPAAAYLEIAETHVEVGTGQTFKRRDDDTADEDS